MILLCRAASEAYRNFPRGRPDNLRTSSRYVVVATHAVTLREQSTNAGLGEKADPRLRECRRQDLRLSCRETPSGTALRMRNIAYRRALADGLWRRIAQCAFLHAITYSEGRMIQRSVRLPPSGLVITIRTLCSVNTSPELRQDTVLLVWFHVRITKVGRPSNF